ncbi:MAG: alcohol dehydrogenase, partial [Polaromonas sp.]|nr:alcohol dehydrogenase [Polaromonas sp.]
VISQIAIAQGQSVYAFTRPGDSTGQRFALSLRAAWAGSSDGVPPVALDAVLIFATIGALVLAALAATHKGGTVVCADIHMSTIPGFDYRLLRGERVPRSVANLTRQDGEDFFSFVSVLPLKIHVQTYSLRDANAAVQAVRKGTVSGAAVLIP